MSNYPDGMSRSDLIFVGALDDPEDYRPCALCGVVRDEHGTCCDVDALRDRDWEGFDEDGNVDGELPEYEPGEFDQGDW